MKDEKKIKKKSFPFKITDANCGWSDEAISNAGQELADQIDAEILADFKIESDVDTLSEM